MLSECRAQSETIGVVTLVGVVLVGVFIFGFAYLGTVPTDEASVADLSLERDGADLIVVHEGGDPLPIAETEVVVQGANGSVRRSLADGSPLSADGDDLFEPGERWRLVDAATDDDKFYRVVNADANEVVYEQSLDGETAATSTQTPTPEPTPTPTPEPTDAPEADAGSDVSITGEEDETQTLDGGGSYDPDGGPVSYEWQVVEYDGLDDEVGIRDSTRQAERATVEVTENVTDRNHTVVVELTVKDDEGDTATDRVNVSVEKINRPPNADAGEDKNGTPDSDGGSQGAVRNPSASVVERADPSASESEVVFERVEKPVYQLGGTGLLTFSLDGSNSSDPDGDPLTYQWSIANEGSLPPLLQNALTLSNVGSQTAQLSVDPLLLLQSRTVEVELTVTDDDGATDTDTVNVTLLPNNEAPEADLIADCTGLTCEFDASGSSDPDLGLLPDDEQNLTYEWAFGDGTTQTTDSPTVSHTYDESGTYDASVTVSDGVASDTATMTVQLGSLQYVDGTGTAICRDEANGGGDCTGDDDDHVRFDVRNGAGEAIRITGVSIVDAGTDDVYVREDDWPFDNPTIETAVEVSGGFNDDWTRLEGLFAALLYDTGTQNELASDPRYIPIVDTVPFVGSRTLDSSETATMTIGSLYRNPGATQPIDLDGEDVTVRVSYEYVGGSGSGEHEFTFTDGGDDSSDDTSVRGLRLEDQSQYSNAEYDISYDISNADPDGRVEVSVDNRQNTWSDRLLESTDTRGTLQYSNGGTMGDTYEITVRAYGADGTLLTEESIVDVADGTDPPQKGTLTKPTSPTIESVSVKDKTKRDNGDYQVKVKVEDSDDEFSRTEVIFQNNDHSWATRTESSTQKNAVLRYRQGGVEDDSYDIVVRVVDSDGIVVDEQVVTDTADGNDP
ncbi:rej domain protein [Haloferax elongans ATCC BAA-1513]|uniref:Rej domain protein n=1 Tax=Haloferax elongans ATCC BAA-1513 TaxID=1230453 RepID=M0HFK4_HALEO|nr:PKD domain-containing protein [Haloferax elongans]ELZ82553.1 rej domain protein [Haloferax elongans ATCC BAA-1513]